MHYKHVTYGSQLMLCTSITKLLVVVGHCMHIEVTSLIFQIINYEFFDISKTHSTQDLVKIFTHWSLIDWSPWPPIVKVRLGWPKINRNRTKHDGLWPQSYRVLWQSSPWLSQFKICEDRWKTDLSRFKPVFRSKNLIISSLK